LHCAGCHGSQLCCHPWQVSSVLTPVCFLCLLMFESPHTLHLPTTRNLDKANQPCTLQFPGIHAIIQTGNAALTTSISQRIFSQPHIAFTCLLHLTTIIPPVHRI
jgi:hypothetical protein